METDWKSFFKPLLYSFRSHSIVVGSCNCTTGKEGREGGGWGRPAHVFHRKKFNKKKRNPQWILHFNGNLNRDWVSIDPGSGLTLSNSWINYSRTAALNEDNNYVGKVSRIHSWLTYFLYTSEADWLFLSSTVWHWCFFFLFIYFWSSPWNMTLRPVKKSWDRKWALKTQIEHFVFSLRHVTW